MDKELKDKFSVSFKTGFLPEEPPLARLPEPFHPWEELMENLSYHLKSKSLRKEVDENLPLITVSNDILTTERHWQRACKILTFLSQGYMWQDGEEGTVSKLPKQLAIPWWEVNQRLGLPPVATYAAVVLWNWQLKKPSGPITLDNLQMDTYTGTKDEEWFYLISAASEISAIKGIGEVWKCLEEVKKKCIPNVLECLDAIFACIQEMTNTLDKMYQKCEPENFYGQVRIFQGGSKDLKAFSGGLIFEGVSIEPKGFPGASAAQSSTIPVFDILLGVEHTGHSKEFLDVQRWHMPRPHRQFLLDLALKPSLRGFVIDNRSNESLVKSYNRCAEALAEFRSKHIVLVTRYIVVPASASKAKTIEQTADQEKGDLAITGTGGTDFMTFLKSSRDETLKCCLDWCC